MKSKFNLMNKDILESNSASYADTFGETLALITQLNKVQEEKDRLEEQVAKDKEDSIEQRLRRLEEAVFGEEDDRK